MVGLAALLDVLRDGTQREAPPVHGPTAAARGPGVRQRQRAVQSM